MTQIAKRRISEIAPMAALTAATLVGSAACAQDFPLNSYIFGTIPFKNEASLSRPEARLAIHDTAVIRLKPAAAIKSKDNLSDINAPPCTGVKALDRQEAGLLVEKIAAEEKFDVKFALAVARQESRFVSNIRSPRGAYGLMQLMPATATDLGVDLCDPAGNVRGGIRYLRQLEAEFKNPIYVLSAYNAGPRRVQENAGVPPIHETVNYVAAILNDLNGWPEVKRPSRANNLRTKAAGRSPPTGQPDTAIAGGPQRVLAAAEPRADTASWKSGFVMNFD